MHKMEFCGVQKAADVAFHFISRQSGVFKVAVKGISRTRLTPKKSALDTVVGKGEQIEVEEKLKESDEELAGWRSSCRKLIYIPRLAISSSRIARTHTHCCPFVRRFESAPQGALP